jgi:RHS repeat-associated protein
LKTATGANRSLLNYSYDNDDNIIGISDGVTAANSVSYAYDARGRLNRTTSQTGTYKREDVAYDANACPERLPQAGSRRGNRTLVERRTNATDVNPAQTDSYTRTANSNRLASITGVSGTRSFAYDARGNLLGETRPSSISVTTVYDGHGRLTSYTRTGDATQSNVYNGLDQRVSVTSGSTIRRFVYDPDGRVLGEYGTSATNVIAERIWLTPEINDGDAFGGDDGTGGYAPIAIVIGTTLRWVHGNHLGVPILYTSNSGAVITTPAYTLPGFPGQLRTFADLYYNLYRDYDPTTGRYIQADPIGLAGGQAPYLYAMGNPLSYIDPLGLMGAGAGGNKSKFTGTYPGYNPRLTPKKKDDCDPPPVDWCGSQGFNVPDGNWGDACRNHDDCYGRPGASKERCDAQLALEITAECSENTYFVAMPICVVPGLFYGAGLMALGIPNPVFQPARDAYNDAQRGQSNGY